MAPERYIYRHRREKLYVMCRKRDRKAAEKMTPEEQRRQISEENKRAQASKYRSGIDSREANPCFYEQQLSMKCLYSTEKEKQDDECKLYFDNYNTCKQFWLKVQMNRRQKGIQPELPPIEEREKIKAQFLGQ